MQGSKHYISTQLHIPLSPGSLFGREQELATLCQRLLHTETRMLTLTGTGGIGKTRLALAAAYLLQDRFADGVWFVDLAPLPPLSHTNLVLATLSQALGIQGTTGGSSLEALALHLHDKRLLIVLDNFEHVLPSAPSLAWLLAHCPSLKLLITSREPLHLRWEYLFVLSPLALPDIQKLPSLPILAEIPAITLFIARAQAVRPDFELTQENAPIIASICTRLDGLPLALEIAASRLSALSPNELLSHLRHQLSLLHWSARDLPSRQQTLRATIDWSYNLLSRDEQTLFRQLSVFVGSWSLEAVEAVAASNTFSKVEVLDAITALIDKGLLQRRQTEDGLTRFHMLEMIREYAAERLHESDEALAIQRRHADWYLDLAIKARAHWSEPGERTWLRRLEQENDNLRRALQWSIEHGVIEMEARLCAALWMMWLRGHLREGQVWMAGILTRAAALPAALRAQLLTGAASLALPLGYYEQAETCYREALALQQALGDAHGVAYSLNLLGMVAIDKGDLEAANKLLKKSVMRFRSLQNAHGIAFSLDNLGRVMVYRTRYKEAAACLQEALSIWRSLGNVQGIAETTIDLALLATRRDEDTVAITLYHEALTRLQELGNAHLIAWCIEGLADIAYIHEQLSQAAYLWGIASALRTCSGAPLKAIEKSEYDRAVSYVQKQLGTKAFLSAWIEGNTLPLEKAVETVLTNTAQLLEIVAHTSSEKSCAHPSLSTRESEVLQLVTLGLSNKEIARRLFISENTVKYHITSIFNKLGANTRAQAVSQATQYGLL